jgi:hypothetical protein
MRHNRQKCQTITGSFVEGRDRTRDGINCLAAERLRRHRRLVHGLHRLHAGRRLIAPQRTKSHQAVRGSEERALVAFRTHAKSYHSRSTVGTIFGTGRSQSGRMLGREHPQGPRHPRWAKRGEVLPEIDWPSYQMRSAGSGAFDARSSLASETRPEQLWRPVVGSREGTGERGALR